MLNKTPPDQRAEAAAEGGGEEQEGPEEWTDALLPPTSDPLDQGGHQGGSDSDSTEPLNTEEHLEEGETEEDLEEGNSEPTSLEEANNPTEESESGTDSDTPDSDSRDTLQPGVRFSREGRPATGPR